MGKAQDGGAVDAAVLQVLQSLIRLRKRVDLNGSLDRDFGGEAQALADVVTRAVGGGAQEALVIQQVIIHGWDLRHGDSGQRHGSALAYSAQSRGNERSGGGKDDGGVEAVPILSAQTWGGQGWGNLGTGNR